MANVNVRFYKLNVLPSFEEKHKGIFVHVAETMQNTRWTPTNHPKEVDPKTLLITTAVKEEDKIYLSTWLSKRNITFIESGLWFGGENGWELLSNETNSAAINAAIDAKINALNAGGFTQATISGSTLTISGIKETKGKIEQDDTKNVNIAIDGTYNETTNKIATQDTVTNAINNLDSEGTIQAVTTAQATDNIANTVLTFNGVKEVNGKILQGDGASKFTVGDAKLKIQIGSNEAGAFDVFSANAKENKSIKLNGNVFTKDENNVISVITLTAVSESNKLVTQADINSLASAMHYRGGVTSVPTPDQNTKHGDVWIVTTAFDGYEAGDMFIARGDGTSATFDKVQGNLTLGTGDGQIAKNVGALATGNNVVIATSGGIKTIDITENDLTNTTEKNKRTLSIGDGEADTTGVCHDVTITDALTVIGKPFTETINISSTNRSIEIKKKTVGGVDTGVMVDLVWNTSIE